MSDIERSSMLVPEGKSQLNRYINDSLLVLGSTSILTGIIYLIHLDTRIPDSFLLYLLAILALAGMRGLYASLLASFTAFFSFDFFFVPPLYNLRVSKFEDVLTLVIFLLTALITSQLASALRDRAQYANRREMGTRILYDLLRATNREEDMEGQLPIFAQAIVEVFSFWGIRDCMFLLPDAAGEFLPPIGRHGRIEPFYSSWDETAATAWVLAQGRTLDLYHEPLLFPTPGISLHIGTKKNHKKSLYIRFVPLKTDQKTVGVLILHIEHNQRLHALNNYLGVDHEHPTQQAVFFSTFLEQAVALIERERLRSESLHIKILQQTDTLRAALLSSVSHDLRTPLSTIKTAATSLLQKEVKWDEETQHSFAAAIVRESDRLNRLVENLLDMSRIEAGTLHPEKVWYPIDELVRDVVHRTRERLQERIVQIDIPDDLPPVKLDYVQIDQVVTNILENAVCHTPEGIPIEICITVQEAQIQVSIADHGPGIAPAAREHIFDKFYRVLKGPTNPRNSRGSGLGLAICRGYVEAHGGCIWMEARKGGGSVFHFTLPLSEMDEIHL
jgi:two-component system sensor histidine kinase KdpD